MKEPTECDISDYFRAVDQFDTLIDVRSPAEYRLDHIPGAINLPVLSDPQREQVGTVNAQESSFHANKLGAGLIAANISDMLTGPLADKPRDWRVAVYCWRGGNRSGSLGTILARVGWRTAVVSGGYRAYRQWLLRQFEPLTDSLKFQVIAGRTGTGKSRILQALSRAGAQVLDLEELANHRGSVLGLVPGDTQPTQKMFDSRLGDAMRGLDPARPVFVESESRKVGQVQLPEALITKIRQSPCHVIEMTVMARAHFLINDYAHFLREPEILKHQLLRLKDKHGKQRLEHWHQLIDQQTFDTLVQELLEQHYDPAYDRSMNKNFSRLASAHKVSLPPAASNDGDLSAWFEQAADQILSAKPDP